MYTNSNGDRLHFVFFVCLDLFVNRQKNICTVSVPIVDSYPFRFTSFELRGLFFSGVLIREVVSDPQADVRDLAGAGEASPGVQEKWPGVTDG